MLLACKQIDFRSTAVNLQNVPKTVVHKYTTTPNGI